MTVHYPISLRPRSLERNCDPPRHANGEEASAMSPASATSSFAEFNVLLQNLDLCRRQRRLRALTTRLVASRA